MRPVRPAFLALAALALAASASAATFQEIRSSEPAVDRAITAMPSSGITGTLNRLSAQLQQPHVGDLSEATQKRLSDTLQALETDLRNGLPSLSVRDRLVIAQVVEEVAFDGVLPLYSGRILVGGPCPSEYHDWHGQCHPEPWYVLDRIAELLEGSIREGFDRFEADNPSINVPDIPAAPAGGMDADAFDDWLDDVLSGPGLATGAESIDD